MCSKAIAFKRIVRPSCLASEAVMRFAVKVANATELILRRVCPGIAPGAIRHTVLRLTMAELCEEEPLVTLRGWASLADSP